MTRTTTTSDSGHTTPEKPYHHCPPTYDYIDAIVFDAYDYPDHGHAEVNLTYNYGPHASSTGSFNLDATFVTPTGISSRYSTPLGATKHDAIAALNNIDDLAPIHDELSTAIHQFTPFSTLAPGWADRNDIPSLDDSQDAHATSDPRFLTDHPNLATTDDDSLGEYRIPSANTDGVAVHRPSWKHRDIDRTEYPYAVTGAGHKTTPVTEVRVDGEPIDYAGVVGWFQGFFPNATLTLEAEVAHITTDDGREWLPQTRR